MLDGMVLMKKGVGKGIRYEGMKKYTEHESSEDETLYPVKINRES